MSTQTQDLKPMTLLLKDCLYAELAREAERLGFTAELLHGSPGAPVMALHLLTEWYRARTRPALTVPGNVDEVLELGGLQ